VKLAITVCINGTKREIEQGATLAGVIDQFQLKPKSVVIELNQRVVERSGYSTTQLQDNDVLEIVRFVGGG